MFELAWPASLLLLPLPWLLRWLLPPAKRPEAALQIAFLARLQRLNAAQLSAAGTHRRSAPLILIWLLLVLAAARPQLLGAPLPPPSSGRDMMLAVDLSASMDTRDMRLDDQPSDRLSVVKHWLDALIEQRTGDRIGLILFGTRAYVQSPLTYDLHSVRQWLDEAFIGLAGRDTAIGDAIGLAIKRLMEQPTNSRVLLLVTDGANTAGSISPIQAARLAADEHIRIFTIGVGAESQGNTDLMSLLEGNADPASDLDEPTLQEIAKITDGAYFRVRDSASLASAVERIEQLEPSLRSGPATRQALPLYHWPLAIALLISLLWSSPSLRRRLHAD
ncbi:VWA domain-containing protein [Halopseudomonas aestusnigri]|jgi:Ca-activated chloride channel family protein|uniref:VWA domain-containing protein n=1 Tax=Halopseudomonas TaxID=2901189 RepID=UPI000C5DB78F|nr:MULTISPECIES: VWA domain-containing protein [Halopseudomonas]MAK75111.1 BatB protein [Pseudomonadales bacterium]HBT57320.1 BatB protein [Pseudomonas sp.]MAP75948.1 BatB protein [Pseudomonadales bacterium]MAS65903.1 BatB protein [Pseudomonadales bacterium]MAY08604.1 BatB protein [Pseudomonadales bacterium]|tara:strand:+ start:7011 stop:8009 length:999 start_codon:yes stop_codon:yes gene_type:complete